MYSIKVVCLMFCVEFLITVRGDVKSQFKSLNATAAEDRKDGQLKKPPRKRGNHVNSFHILSLSIFTASMSTHTLLLFCSKPTVREVLTTSNWYILSSSLNSPVLFCSVSVGVGHFPV